MAVYDIIPQSFTWDDLRDTLNSKGGRVADSDGSSAFDERGKVNMWSKNKPVRGVPAGMNPALPDYNGNWYMGVDLNCSIIPQKIPTPKHASSVQNDQYDWVYDRPNGYDSYYRIGDFVGYDPNALPPFNTGKKVSETLYSNTGSHTLYIYPNLTGSRFVFSDFYNNSASIGSCYMYAIMYNSADRAVAIARSERLVNQWNTDGNDGLSIDMSRQSTGTYMIYCFFSDEESLSYNFTDSEWGDYILYSVPYSTWSNPFTLYYRYNSSSGISASFNGCTNGGYFPDYTDIWEPVNSIDNQGNPYECPNGYISFFMDVYNGTENIIALSGSNSQIRYRDIHYTERIINFSQCRGRVLDENGEDTGETWNGAIYIPANGHKYFSIDLDLYIDTDNEGPFKTQFSLYRNNIFSGSNIDDIWIYPYYT